MTTLYESDEKFIEDLVYEALLILHKEGSKTRGELMTALEEQQHLGKMPTDLEEAIADGRTKLGDRFGATAQTVFVDAGFLTKGGSAGWQLTSDGTKAFEAGGDKQQVIKEAKGRAAERRKYTTHLAYVAMVILDKNEGKMLLSDLMGEIKIQEGDKMFPDMKDLDSSGAPKWDVRMREFARSCLARAGYITMSEAVWEITPAGEGALKSGNEEDVIRQAKKIAQQARKRKTSEQQIDAESADAEQDLGSESEDVDDGLDIEGYQSAAKAAIRKHIHSMGAYDFQDLCAALLRGMGYHIPEPTVRGSDGGVDIVAYTDPLGGKPPRIKVQVKRYKDSSNISVDELDKLAGKIRKGEIGVLVTTSGFTRDCKRAARDHPNHIELIDFNRFAKLWVAHYDNLEEADKQRLPLVPIYFLAKK